MTGIRDVGHVGRGEEEEFGSSGGKTRGGGGGGGPWLVRARPRRRLARNYAYFVFEYNLLSFERGPRLFATFARFFSLAFPLHSLPPSPRFYLLFRDTRPVVKLIDPLWLRCRVHATTNSRTRHRVSDHASFVVRKWTNWRVRWLVNEGWVSLKDEAIVGSRRKERRKEGVDWWIHYNVLRCICCYWNLN